MLLNLYKNFKHSTQNNNFSKKYYKNVPSERMAD